MQSDSKEIQGVRSVRLGKEFYTATEGKGVNKHVFSSPFLGKWTWHLCHFLR